MLLKTIMVMKKQWLPMQVQRLVMRTTKPMKKHCEKVSHKVN